jgi:N-acetylglucosamine-6-phosphate deacetylase
VNPFTGRVYSAHWITPQGEVKDCCLTLSGGRIVALQTGVRPPRRLGRGELAAEYLLPGLIDIHCHGGPTEPKTLAELTEMLLFHHRAGTSELLWTIAFETLDRLSQRIAWAKTLMEDPAQGLLGIHLEGPFIAPDRVGALPRRSALPCSERLVAEIIRLGKGVILTITLAPELPGALGAIRALSLAGIRVMLGHSNATYAQAQAACLAGARGITHLGNAMPLLHHRAPGLVGAGLDFPGLAIELIPDGEHIAPEVLCLWLRAKKGPAIFVSDCRGHGRKRGTGAARTRQGALAGGGAPLWGQISGQRWWERCSWRELSNLTHRNPAGLLGIKTSSQPGNFASLLLLDRGFTALGSLARGFFYPRADGIGRA